ncbi:SusC/RagA family TonB-linked outer membrane protein [Pedobacter nyackensis]|uniref:SusC/RagA family TonB-linked outer membrane protein n=1 Tax=Pedobacter nyackensis TaxID=475255 RepID=UPI00292FC36B|nr:SusC/RagA family TonB-linked outer membrane protein [Pedobacter nyackensis]
MKTNAFNLGVPHMWLPPKLLLIMKLVVVMMIASLMQVTAAGFAQKITLKENNATLSTVIEKLRNQTGYDFLFDFKLIKNAKRVNIEVKNASLPDVLGTLFRNQDLSYSIKDNFVVIEKKTPTFIDNLLARFQKIDVYGRVFDEDGNVLPGATVKIKGSTKSVITGSDGVFTFSDIEDNLVLVFSYIGYKTQEVSIIGKKMPLKVVLLAARSELEEVNVSYSTGYQRIPKESATGSYGIITAEELGKKVAPGLLERLEGTTSGLLINVGTPDRSLTTNRDNFTIRGTSTINSEKKPLIVLDGFPTELDLVNINPDNVESITVLKDAAAASIWGVRAANGVIVIASKKGTYSNRAVVSYSSNFNLTGRPRLDYRKVLNAEQYLDYEKEMVDKGLLPAQKLAMSLYPQPLTPGADLALQLKKGTISQQQYIAETQRLSQLNVNNQYQQYLLQSPFAQQHTLSVSGGSAITRNYLSAAYNDERTNSKGDYNNRMVISFSNETKITPKLTVSAETFITLLKQKNNGIGLRGTQPGTNTLLPYDQLVDASGSGVNFSYKTNARTLDSLQNKGYLPWKYNYLDELAGADNTNRSVAYRLTGGVNYKTMPWMSVDLKYMTERSFTKTRNFYNENTYTTRDLINRFTTTDTHVRGIPVGGILNLDDVEQNNYNIRGQLNFNPDLKSAGRLDAIVGAELRQTLTSGYGNTLYGYDDRLLSSTAVNFFQTYKTADGNVKIPYPQNVMNRKDRYASVFGNFTYTYKNRYSLSGSFRKDDSNLFGADNEFRTVPLWSLGGLWRANEEEFMVPAKWLSKLNFRATVGYNGNLNKETSPYLTMQQSGIDPINADPYASITNPANPQLRWERVRTFNLGTDFSLFNYRINGTIDAYWRKSLDLLGPVEIDPTFGFTSLRANQLEMTGRGVDIELNAKVFNSSVFSWTPSLSVSFNKNKVAKAYFQQQTTQYYIRPENPIQGQQLGSLYTYRFAGLNENGNAMIYNGKGEKILADLNTFDEKDINAVVYQGNTTPPYFGGFANTFRYKNFELYTLLTFKAGHKFMRTTTDQVFELPYTRVAHSDLAMRWRVSGDELKTNTPAIDPLHTGTYRYINSDYFVENASYVRFRDISLAYNIPVGQLKWNAFQALNVSVTGRNLALWTANKKGIDPDYLDALRSSVLPPSKSFVFSIKATF